MMEAYNAVYTPQITEEQLWEEVEEWVNSLVEEGYDLSEYTWEEMYDAYIEEQGGQRGSGARPSQTNQSVSGKQVSAAVGSAASRVAGGVRTAVANTPAVAATRYVAQQAQRASAVPSSGGPRNVRGGGSRPSPSPTPAKPSPSKPSSEPYKSKFAGSRDQAFSKAQGIKGSPVVGPKASSSSSAPSRPSSTPAAAPSRPAAPAKASPAPAASRPSSTPAAAPAKASPAPSSAATPAKAPEAPKKPSVSDTVSDLRAMRARSLERQGKPAAATAVAATTKPAFKENIDLYNTVIGHLLGEGYADTEEAAIAIMANMSEEWRESIIENYLEEQRAEIGTKNYGDKTADKWNKGYQSYRRAEKAGREMTPPRIPQGYKYSSSKGTVEKDPSAAKAAPKPTRMPL